MKSILSFLFIGLIYSINYSQCTNVSPFGTVAAPTNTTPVTISTCNYQTEYSTLTGVLAGSTFQATVSSASCVTVHSGTPNGPIVAFGPAPLNFTATVSGDYFLHYNTNWVVELQLHV